MNPRATRPISTFRRANALLLFIFLLALALRAMELPQSAGLPAPGVIADVVCASDTTQSYALYLPSGYVPGKNWPIIYFFDPGGHGRRPLELYKDLADQYGFIFAGSNNSRNFSSEQSKSVNAIWLDTHIRLPLDEHRTYVSGFSGGARVAGAMALTCSKCGIAGVIAHGAGYPSSKSQSDDRLLYFFSIGNEDFNWPEIMSVRREREEHGQPYRVHVFSGPHQWGPHIVMEDALQWLTLKAMQAGTMKPDPDFVERAFQQIQAEAREAEKANDALAQFDAVRSLSVDFSGLRDTGDATARLNALKQSSALKSARKAERDAINDQFSLESEISPKLRTYAEGSEPDPAALQREIQQAMGRLQEQALHAKNESKRLVFKRALEDMWAEGIENGQQELAARHFDKAESCFQLMSLVRDQPWPFLLLAQTHVAQGRNKDALRDLQQSVHHGLKDPSILESNPDFQALKNEPEFQKLISQLKNP
jgi:dienelactone hydrolase